MEIRAKILEAYGAYLREHGAPPATVFKFCRELEIGEREFFQHFASFDAVESEMWRGLVDRVAQAVESGPEWSGFSARQRLLAFLFAFCEESLGWRSLLLARVGKGPPVVWPGHLRGLETGFGKFFVPVLEHGRDRGEIAGRGPIGQVYPAAFALHFRAVVDFHLRDTSPGYERTDAFIEKSTTLAFDLIGRQALDSAFDFLKFLFPRPH